MRIAGLIRDSLANGQGVRDVVFAQGCEHHCEGCHNPHTWNTKAGKVTSVFTIVDMLADSPNDVTISGGEPMLQWSSLELLTYLLYNQSHKHSWLYTGFTFDEVPMKFWKELSDNGVTVVVDGKFEKDKADASLRFRGSSNQRLIDLKKSVECGEVVLWEECHEEGMESNKG